MKISALLLAALTANSVQAFAPASLAKGSIMASTSTTLFHGQPKHAPTHDTGGGKAPEMSPEEMKTQAAFAEHQQNCPKLGFPTDVRTLVEYNHGFAVMSTNSKAKDGYPNGSVVGFAPDEDGNPIFIFSGMSSHTQDILKDPRCSLTVASKQFKGAADGRVNLMGTGLGQNGCP